jgi:hypothetical protein
MKTTENDEDHHMEFLGGNQSTLATPAAAARSFRTVETKTHVRILPNILRGEPPRGGEGGNGAPAGQLADSIAVQPSVPVRGWRSAFLRARRSTSASALGLFRTAILFPEDATRARTLRGASKMVFFGTASIYY